MRFKKLLFNCLVLLGLASIIAVHKAALPIKAHTENLLQISKLANNLEPQGVPLDGIFQITKGSNSNIEGNTVVITKKRASQKGSIYSTEKNKLDLTKDFKSVMYLKIDGTADGIAFALHNEVGKTTSYLGEQGGGLGVYSGKFLRNSNGYYMNNPLKNSFVIEFDTYKNGDGYDSKVSASKDGDKGHVAYSFPGQQGNYIISTYYGGTITEQKHYGLQYPKDYGFSLGDNQWRRFTVDWKAFDKSNNGQIEYQLEGMPPVSATVPKSTFGVTSVYWGFAGSTGGLSEEAVVKFKSVPGLVNYEDALNVKYDEGNLVDSGSIVSGDSELLVSYSGTYKSGKQDMKNPAYEFTLNNNIEYIEDSFTINGQKVKPDYKNNVLSGKFSDLSDTNQSVEIKYKVKNLEAPEKYSVTIGSMINSDNYFQDEPTTISYEVQPTPFVMSADFDNQKWLINQINQQLSPLEIDKTLHQSALKAIKIIDTDAEGVFEGQHIPANIYWLTNLETLRLKNKKLINTIPVEIGKLTKLKELIINENNLTGGLPESLGDLTNLETLDLSNNQLSGSIPESMTKLTKLQLLNLSKNKFIEQLPNFSTGIKAINFEETQITYNSNVVPDFLTDNKNKTYNQTFVDQNDASRLYLEGNDELKIPATTTIIKPFDSSDVGYFNLKAVIGSTGNKQELYEGHSYSIYDDDADQLLYTGTAKKETTIEYSVGKNYRVVLDGAEDNPNNVFKISPIATTQLVVRYLDENKNPLADEYKETVNVGSTIKTSEIESVDTTLNLIINKNYLLPNRPENETLKIDAQEKNNVVTYNLVGTLAIVSIPETFEFGEQTHSLTRQKYRSKTTKPLVIADTRSDSNGWKLNAKITVPLTSKEKENGQTAILANAIKYKSNNDEILLTDENKEILKHKNNSPGNYNITEKKNWNKDSGDGFLLDIKAGQVSLLGKYHGEVTITIESVK
ncbi:hypothetical protein ABID30_002412 [Enterococcus rotai]|uniref:WxL domain-containing protein n=1 Tax=Enterococcus rotai TaxID=118060 RepID=A0A0U2LUW2_9ENTE|nr:L-type lectin-domain containing protein [Enterococcus rotai]ALS36453.1 hypothetical protein ATZ35_04530 [Enterococcus rotai]